MDVKADPSYGAFSDRGSDMPSFTGNDDYTNYMGSNLFNSHVFLNSDSQRLLTGSDDGQMKIYDVAHGTLVST